MGTVGTVGTHCPSIAVSARKLWNKLRFGLFSVENSSDVAVLAIAFRAAGREVYTGSDTTRQSQDLVRQFGRSYLLVFEMCFGEELYGSERDDAIYSGRRSYGVCARALERKKGSRITGTCQLFEKTGNLSFLP